MAGIKETLTKGITTINVKTNNMIEINKIKTNISALESEIKTIKYQIGDITYDSMKMARIFKKEFSCLLKKLMAINKR